MNNHFFGEYQEIIVQATFAPRIKCCIGMLLVRCSSLPSTKIQGPLFVLPSHFPSLSTKSLDSLHVFLCLPFILLPSIALSCAFGSNDLHPLVTIRALFIILQSRAIYLCCHFQFSPSRIIHTCRLRVRLITELGWMDYEIQDLT